MRTSKIITKGEFVYSFGKNGSGITDEFESLNNYIKNISKDNYVFMTDAIIDAADDVYELKFNVIPKTDDYLFNDNENIAWYSNLAKKLNIELEGQPEVLDEVVEVEETI